MRCASIVILLVIIWSSPAAAFILPYSTRTQNFSSWTPVTLGDTNTIGMAGATVALPTSISSAETNPSGYAMTTGAVSAQYNSINQHDQRLQASGDPISTSQWGFAVSPAHWGFAIAYYSPETESGTYVSPNTGDTAKTEVSLKELRFTAARTFFNDKLAIGLTLELAKAVRELNDTSSNTFGPSAQLGALYRLRDHVLIGASIEPQVTVGPSGHADSQSIMPGFNRAVVRPTLFTLGVGWMPNRFFKLGFSMTYAGATDNTALLYDQTIISGQTATYIPRIGASYVIAEYPNLKIEAAGGTYYESSRLSNESNRIHMTGGLDLDPSFVNLGAGFDLANGYQNYIVSVGIDIVRTLRTFDIIPPEKVPSYNGFFPRAAQLSSEGLPAGMTSNERKQHEGETVKEISNIVANVPENIAKKAEGEETNVQKKKKKSKKKKVFPETGSTSGPTENKAGHY